MYTFKSFNVVGVICVALSLGGAALAQEARQWGQNRSITQISKSVYRFGSDNQFGAYVLTAEGIIVVDGHYCQSNTTQWLKSELEKRHDVPVKYVVLSHDHQDHNCHTGIFSDTAVTIGHRNILPHIVRENRNSAVPTILFDDEMDIVLGGVTVRLLFFGPTHSDNLIQVHIPDEQVLIAVDMAKGRSIFPDYRDMEVNNTLRVLKILAHLPDVDVVLPGHGPVTTQQNFNDSRHYIEALRDEVLRYMVEGMTLDEMRKRIELEDFSDYTLRDRFFDGNIVSMYHYLYRYREPNSRITTEEAVECRDRRDCRTSGEIEIRN